MIRKSINSVSVRLSLNYYIYIETFKWERVYRRLRFISNQCSGPLTFSHFYIFRTNSPVFCKLEIERIHCISSSLDSRDPCGRELTQFGESSTSSENFPCSFENVHFHSFLIVEIPAEDNNSRSLKSNKSDKKENKSNKDLYNYDDDDFNRYHPTSSPLFELISRVTTPP